MYLLFGGLRCYSSAPGSNVAFARWRAVVLQMFALLSANKTLDNDWAGDYYARSPSKALSSADALYVFTCAAAVLDLSCVYA